MVKARSFRQQMLKKYFVKEFRVLPLSGSGFCFLDRVYTKSSGNQHKAVTQEQLFHLFVAKPALV